MQVRFNLLPFIKQRLDLYVDVLNVLALRTTTGVTQNEGPTFGLPTGRTGPMRIRLGSTTAIDHPGPAHFGTNFGSVLGGSLSSGLNLGSSSRTVSGVRFPLSMKVQAAPSLEMPSTCPVR